LKQALGGGSLVVLGSGEQTRDFVYVDDVVEALVAAASAQGVDQRVINVGSGVEVSVNALVAMVERAVGDTVNLIRNQDQSGGVSRLCADIALARQLLRFEPRVGLEEGLRKTIQLDPQFNGPST